MASWTAINLEPEETITDEVDETKELQLEEAFKLYQNALKLHSQGAPFYEQAAEAYRELFQSEVFKYPEAASEFDNETEELSAVQILPTEEATVVLASGPAPDTSANSLPQLVYLAQKARAQFVIDVARSRQLNQIDRRDAFKYYSAACLESLVASSNALERDDTDIDLWKKGARVAQTLSSDRLARFCLESVLAGDDEGDQDIDLSGLDEAFAEGQLEKVLAVLQDDLSQSRKNHLRPKTSLLRILDQSSDPFPFLPTTTEQFEYVNDARRPLVFHPNETEVIVPRVEVLTMTQALLQALTEADSNEVSHTEGIIRVSLPNTGSDHDSASAEPELHQSPSPVKENLAISTPINEDTIAPSPASFHSAPDKPLDTESADAREPDVAQPENELKKTTANDLPTADVTPHDEGRKSPEMISLPSRKRSSTAAGHDEPEARSKSKRIRARESLIELSTQDEEVSQEPSYLYRDQIALLELADDNTFATVNKFLDMFKLDSLVTAAELRQRHSSLTSNPETNFDDVDASTGLTQLSRDLQHALLNWDEEKTAAFTAGHGAKDHVEKSTGVSLFLKHSKMSFVPSQPDNWTVNDNIALHFARDLQDSSLTLGEVLFAWLVRLFTQISSTEDSAYMISQWDEALKQSIVSLLVKGHEHILRAFNRTCYNSDAAWTTETLEKNFGIGLRNAQEFAQTAFELHLDIFSEMTNPASEVDQDTREAEAVRLGQWAQITADLAQISFAQTPSTPEFTQGLLKFRYLWSSIVFAKLSDHVDKGHVLACLQDMISMLQTSGIQSCPLPNNNAMPIISVEAAQQEVHRLNTLEFFMSVFDSDNSDPLAVITKLEPILEQSSIEYTEDDEIPTEETPGPSDEQATRIREFRSFLASGDPSLTLFLWRRLQNAYTAISYRTKVLSCLLRSIETIVQELVSERQAKQDRAERQSSLLRWCRDADELAVKVIAKMSDKDVFEIFDEAHLRQSIESVYKLLSLIHEFVLVDDDIRVGLKPTPLFRNATAGKAFEKSRDRFREMYVRLWIMLYFMLREACSQFPADAVEDLDPCEYLHAVHASIGQRQYCRHSGKLFLRVAKAALLPKVVTDGFNPEIAQVLYDLYQIKVSAGYGDADHGCPPESLEKDKQTAQSLIPVIMSYAKTLNVRDLIKGELKSTIDKMQVALGAVKPNPALQHNRRTISAFLKAPINPRHLYESLKGIGDLTTKDVEGDAASVAKQGWYLLLGSMTLAKYRSIKRVNPTPTDDLEIAGTFLRHDLEYCPLNWESWFRLAQVYDAKIEDNLIWNSAKLNDAKAEISLQERNCIHSYSMAMSLAMRSADDDPATLAKLDEMFYDFAVRLYSSSRPPLNMDAFSTEKAIRHISSLVDQTMSKITMFQPMSDYAVWGLAAYLLRRRFRPGKPHWLRSYLLGKCFWKMYRSQQNLVAKRPVRIEDVLDALTDAVEEVPKKPKSGDPILEPHLKIVSVVHKLKETNAISVSEGVQYLQVTQYARSVSLTNDRDGKPDWDEYILTILKRLQTADKSNWHHRIIARAAHVCYDNDPEPKVSGALGARHHFTQQIFTKTMAMQVWKPEFERAGRHYVYTGRYLTFFVDILKRLKDRSNLEQVIRRIRRKFTDFIDHPKMWEYAVTTYVDLLRDVAKVERGKERTLFDSISFDEFTRMSEKLETWAHDQEGEGSTALLGIMQDAIELKKLNNSLMKGSAIDDLIGDTYATMYDEYVRGLPEEERNPQPPKPVGAVQGTFINMNGGTAMGGDDGLDRMRLGNLVASHEAQESTAATAVGLGISTPSQAFVGTPPPDANKPERAKPGRAKTITRREVQKKAEAAIVKPPPIKTPTLMKRIVIDVPKRKEGEDGDEEDKSSEREGTAMPSGVNSRRGSFSRGPSARASVEPRDEDNEGDADDESELSEPEENENDEERPKARTSMFPGLPRKRAAEDEQDEDQDMDAAEAEGAENDEDEDVSDRENEDGGENDEEEDEPEAEDVSKVEAVEIPDSQDFISKREAGRAGAGAGGSGDEMDTA